MTLNGVIALILLYFTEFDSVAGLLHHSGSILSAEYRLSLLDTTEPACSAVSLRQLSYLFVVVVVVIVVMMVEVSRKCLATTARLLQVTYIEVKDLAIYLQTGRSAGQPIVEPTACEVKDLAIYLQTGRSAGQLIVEPTARNYNLFISKCFV